MQKWVRVMLMLLGLFPGSLEPILFSQETVIRGFTQESSRAERAMEAKFLAVPSPEMVQRQARFLTEEPHTAGTAGGKRVADYVLAKFKKYGVPCQLYQYDVLLSYPQKVELEMVQPTQAKLANREAGYAQDKDTYEPTLALPWHAYAASADLMAQVVYVNYGAAEDYDRLADLGVDVRGKLALARYFHGYRGGKSLEAERRGVAGLITYSDPADDGYVQGDVYPDGPWGPESHFQRGANVYDFIVPGDPLTPGWASLPGARRLRQEESQILPKIPTLPLSSKDASVILKNLAGPPVPRGWQGGLPFTYHVGPGPAAVHLRLNVTREVRTIYDIVGTITGRDEPEKKIILSNHHDAWAYGAVDPSSGTASLLEVARAFGQLLRQGWRPRRSIILGCWDAEEYTLTGSTEWGEQCAEDLRKNGVACLNVDASTSGTVLAASAVPSLRRFIIETVQEFSDPNGRGTVYDVWKQSRGDQNIRSYATSAASQPKEVDVGILGSGSDYTVFFNHLGMPSMDMLFDGPYGVYHSIYDDFYWMSHFGDPSFRYHALMAKIWGVMALRLANADVLPLDYAAYADDLIAYLDDVQKFGQQRFADFSLARQIELAREFKSSAERFNERIGQTLSGKAGQDRSHLTVVNEALLKIERDLTEPVGIPNRPWFKHLVYAPLPSYQAETLPGIREALVEKDLPTARDQVTVLDRALRRALDTIR